MGEIVKRVTIEYGNLDALVGFVQRRMPSNYPEVLRDDCKKFSFKRRGKRLVEVVMFQISQPPKQSKEMVALAEEALREKKLRPAGIWEIASIVPTFSFYSYSSTEEYDSVKGLFRKEFGEHFFFVGLGHYIKSFLGPQYAVVYSDHGRPRFEFNGLMIPDYAYFVGYREIK